MIKRPMKGAAVNDLTVVRFPCIAFPKIDGFRCILADRPLTSRLSPFPNAHFDRELTGIMPKRFPVVLDGEVTVGRNRGKGVLQRTSSGLTSVAGEPDFTLWVFDSPLVDDVFEIRYDHATEWVKRLNHPRIRILKSRLIYSYDELKAFLDKCLEKGFEGIVTRDPDGLWKDGKSTLREQGMLKVKPFDTVEGRITGWYEQQHNTNEAKREVTGKLKRSSAKAGKVGKGRLGGFILEEVKTGIEVRCGGGFTDLDREELWRITHQNPDSLRGKLVRFEKQAVGQKDKPRHPNFISFVDFRPEWDFTD